MNISSVGLTGNAVNTLLSSTANSTQKINDLPKEIANANTELADKMVKVNVASVASGQGPAINGLGGNLDITV